MDYWLLFYSTSGALLLGYLVGFTHCYYRKQMNSVQLPISIKMPGKFVPNYIQKIIDYSPVNELIVTENEVKASKYEEVNKFMKAESWETS